MSKVKLFISYCQEPSVSKEVLSLADELRRKGVDCDIDQYNPHPKDGWQVWMLKNVKNADFVLVICTKDYYDNFLSGHETRKGSKFEGVLLLTDIYQAGTSNDKYIPVILRSADSLYIPDFLKSYTYYNLDNNIGYEALYRRITNQPEILKPDIGEMEKHAVGTNLSEQTSSVNRNEKQKKETEIEEETLVESSKFEIEIKLKRDLADFTEKDEQRFLALINSALQNSDGIRIKSITRGSTVITLELDSRDISNLIVQMKGGLLNEFDVIEVTLTGPSNSRLNVTEFINQQIDLEKLLEQAKRIQNIDDRVKQDIDDRIEQDIDDRIELLKKIWNISPDSLSNIIEILKKDGYTGSHFYWFLQQRNTKSFKNIERNDDDRK